MSSFKTNPELYYTTAGGVMAFVMALLRSGGFTKKRLAVRLTDACMCSMLSSAITLFCVEYWGLSYVYGVPIGTFVGFVGTDFISTLIKGWVAAKTNNLPPKE